MRGIRANSTLHSAAQIATAMWLAFATIACEPSKTGDESKPVPPLPAPVVSTDVLDGEMPVPPVNREGPFEIAWKNPIRQWNHFSSNLHFNADGTQLLVWFDGQAQVWDTTTWKPAGPRIDYGTVIESTNFSADGTRVLANRRITDIEVSETGGKIFHHRGDEWRVWDARTGKPVGPGMQITFNRHDRETFSIAAMSPDGRLVAAAASPKTLRVYRADSGAVERTFEHETKFYDMRFGDDGNTLLAVDWSGHLNVWDLKTGDLRLTAKTFVTRFAFSAGGRIAGDSLGTLRVCDIQSGEVLLETVAEHPIGDDMCISPRGRHLAIEIIEGQGVKLSDLSTEIWDVDRRVRLCRIPAVRARALDPSGSVVVMSNLNTIPPHRSVIRDVQTGDVVRELGGFVAQAAFSPDGTLLAVITDDQVRVLKADPAKKGAERWRVEGK